MKQDFIKSLDLDKLEGTAHETLEELTERRHGIREMKKRLKVDTQKVEMVKAALTLTEDYKLGKNEETRKAWLVRQQIDNAEYAEALNLQEYEQSSVDTEVIEVERLEGEFSLSEIELRLAAAQLEFMANS